MGVSDMKNPALARQARAHTLQLVGYHIACIMGQDHRISCSPHKDMPLFERTLTDHNRIHVRNEYMAEVAKFLA